MAVVAAAFSGTVLHGHFTDAGAVARGLDHYVGHASGAIFAIILLNASIIGAASVTLATSYAFGDVFGARHSLHRSWREAKLFYGTFTAMVALAAMIVLIPGAPLGLITTGVQALAGVLLPSATVFLLLLCNDKAVLGPWVNGLWLNMVAVFIVSILLLMSLVLMATTLFSDINVNQLAVALGGVLVLGSVIGAVVVAGRALEAPPRREGVEGDQGELADAPPRPARPAQVVEGSAHLDVRPADLPGGGGAAAAGQGDRAGTAQVGAGARPTGRPGWDWPGREVRIAPA